MSNKAENRGEWEIQSTCRATGTSGGHVPITPTPLCNSNSFKGTHQSRLDIHIRKPDLETQTTWGDNWKQSALLASTTLHTYFQNIKGLHLQRTQLDIKKYNLETMQNMGVGLFGLAETYTNCLDVSTQIEYREAVLKALMVAKSTSSTSAIHSASNYKPGGAHHQHCR